ncbi:MAG: TadE/TadG family type IV pilus assembly protein [Candidatus Dormibacteria bacterium]
MRRPERRRLQAQAVIETAIVLPLMLFLIAGFVALMLQVEAQQQLDSAVKLAAEATFQAPRGDADPTTALPVRCRFAWQTFEGSMSFHNGPGDENFDHPDDRDPQHRVTPFLTFVRRPLCLTSHSLPVWPQAANVQCDIDADNRHKSICDAAATLHFDRTPLAWAIFWSPSITSHAEAVAPPFRQ